MPLLQAGIASQELCLLQAGIASQEMCLLQAGETSQREARAMTKLIQQQAFTQAFMKPTTAYIDKHTRV